MSKVLLTVGAVEYGGWETISIRRTLESIAGAYELKVTEFWPGMQQGVAIQPGMRAALSIDGETVITGFVDDVDPEYTASTHDVTIRGRDATGDLVDCSAVPPEGQLGEWTNAPLFYLAKILCDPFGIRVSADTDTGKPLTIFKIELGETVFTAIDRLARLRQVLPVSDGLGGLLFTRAASGTAHSAVKLGQNILKGEGKYSWKERFSDYIVLGQIAGSAGIDPEISSGLKGVAKDPGVTRYRPKLIIDDIMDADSGLYTQRADWEAAVRQGRAHRVTVTVPGWRDAQGKLWRPNDTVRIDDKFLAQFGDLLICGVDLTLDEDGELAALTLTPPDSFLPEPVGPMSDAQAAGFL